MFCECFFSSSNLNIFLCIFYYSHPKISNCVLSFKTESTGKMQNAGKMNNNDLEKKLSTVNKVMRRLRDWYIKSVNNDFFQCFPLNYFPLPLKQQKWKMSQVSLFSLFIFIQVILLQTIRKLSILCPSDSRQHKGAGSLQKKAVPYFMCVRVKKHLGV